MAWRIMCRCRLAHLAWKLQSKCAEYLIFAWKDHKNRLIYRRLILSCIWSLNSHNECQSINKYRQLTLLPIRLVNRVHTVLHSIRTEWYSKWNLDVRYRHHLYKMIYMNVHRSLLIQDRECTLRVVKMDYWKAIGSFDLFTSPKHW